MPHIHQCEDCNTRFPCPSPDQCERRHLPVAYGICEVCFENEDHHGMIDHNDF